MVLVQKQYKAIRRRLDEMGYLEPCSIESLILVEKLLNDLSRTQEKLSLTEDVANSALMKCDTLENSLDSVKKENKHLVKENNKLHLEAIQLKENSEQKVKELKMRITDLENLYSDLEFNYMEQMTNLGVLRQELLDKNNKLYELGIDVGTTQENGKKFNGSFQFSKEIPFLENRSSHDKDQELENHKKQQRLLLEEIEILKNRLIARDEEITRLGYQLEEKNNYGVSSRQKVCSCHQISGNGFSTSEMYEQIKTAQEKQHEAMQRAIYLADHINQLEEEILQLRRRCDKSVNCSCGANITYLKKKHEETLNKIKDMEARMTNLQVLIDNLNQEKYEANNKILNLEKEKDYLSNNLTQKNKEENNLRTEISRLQQINEKLNNELAVITEKNNSLQDLVRNEPISNNKLEANKDDTTIKCGCIDSHCEEIKAERDYYCNELHRLQEKVYSAERIHDIRCCNRSENQSDSMLMKKIQSDLNEAKEENKRLHEEIVYLRNQIKELSNYKYDSNKLVENQIKKLELDKDDLGCANTNLKYKLQSTEKNAEQLNEKLMLLTRELDNYKFKYNHIKKLNMHLEFSLKNSEAATKQAESDLNQTLAKSRALEKDLKCAKEEIMIIKKERQEIRENLLKLDSEKDVLLLKLDDKTILISKLDKELQSKNSQIAQIENKKCKLQTHLQKVERLLQLAEEKSLSYEKQIRTLEKEITTSQSSKENLHLENQSLKREVAALSQDLISVNQALEKSRKEAEDLKIQLQTYVDEVRRVEKILLEKERERELLLEQFNALSAEASNLESNQQSLECEANMTKVNLRDTQQKLSILQQDASAKDSMVSLMETKIRELSDHIMQLQAKISEMSDRELMLTADLDAAHNLCSTLEEQKQFYNAQLDQMTNSEQILHEELNRLTHENETLHHQLGQEQTSSHTLENLLTSSRHEAIEKSMYNEDMTREMKKMKETVAALETKLNSVTSVLRDCQNTCAEYHTQNTQLRRQITNNDFEKAKDLDSNSTSL